MIRRSVPRVHVITDPFGRIDLAYELPGFALVAQGVNTGPACDQQTLVYSLDRAPFPGTGLFGTSYARPEFRTRASSRFDPTYAGAYRGIAYSKTDVSVADGQEIAGTASPATASAVVSASGKIRIRSPYETLSGTLRPVADDPTFFGQGRSENPCDGLFGFTDETGTLVFVVFGADGFSYARLQRHDTWPAIRYDFSSGRAERQIEDGRLGLPLADPTALWEIHCFDVYPWGCNPLLGCESHSGIDLRVSNEGSRRYDVVAPAAGQIVAVLREGGIGSTESPRVVFVLKLNDYWFVILSLETQSLDAGIEDELWGTIEVREFDFVGKGERLGQLVTGSFEGDRLPHVHFALLYKSPDDALDTFTAFTALRGDGRDLAGVWPWRWYPGAWPWRTLPGRSLGTPSKFFCPYHFSSPAAKTAMDAVESEALYGWSCACPCAYNSRGGNCGDAELLCPGT